jgi:hypothetical protein
MKRECTHSSDWWKEMIHCCVCGAEYSDEEADRIANESTRTFSAAQLAIIAAHESEEA